MRPTERPSSSMLPLIAAAATIVVTGALLLFYAGAASLIPLGISGLFALLLLWGSRHVIPLEERFADAGDAKHQTPAVTPPTVTPPPAGRGLGLLHPRHST